MTLLVIGDSHSVIWEGSDVRNRAPVPKFKGVKVHHLNAPLAYNLLSNSGDRPGKWGTETLRIVTAEIEAQNAPAFIMLSFGEIDIRTQVVSRALSLRTSLDTETDKVADRLVQFSSILFDEFQIPILIWSAVPTISEREAVWNPEFPCNGGELERNYCTKRMARTLAAKTEVQCLQGRKIYTFGIVDALTDQGRTNRDF